MGAPLRRSWRFAAIAVVVLLGSVLAWVAIQREVPGAAWIWVAYVSAIPVTLLALVLMDRRRADPVDAATGPDAER